MGDRYEQLNAEERGTIMTLSSQGLSMRGVEEVLIRSPSTISRELRRNGYRAPAEGAPMGRPTIAGGYDALLAGRRARRLRRKARCARKLDPASLLWQQVRKYLLLKWSPEQIAGTLKCVSHETIYTAIYAMPRGALRRELTSLPRQGRAAQKPRSRGQDRRGQLKNMVSIHVRPPAAHDRLLPGHWEGDFIKGAGNRSAVGTLVDRHSLLLMLAGMEDCTAPAALKGFTAAFAPLDPALRQTPTYDQGKEMALHTKLAESTGLAIYFADPHSPWQRGLNENTNGLLRQYLPKGANLDQYSQRLYGHSKTKSLSKNRSERRQFGVARSAGSGVYVEVHEHSEHRTASKCRAQQVIGQALRGAPQEGYCKRSSGSPSSSVMSASGSAGIA